MKLPSAQALAALLCVLWGLAFVVQRVGLRDSGPLWFSAGRAGLGAAALLPALWIGGRLDARGHLLALALGLTNVAAFFALQAAGLAHVESGPAAAIVYLQPLIVIALAHGVLGERASRRRIVGAVLAVGGVGVIGARELADGAGGGAALLFGAALSWAIGTVLLKRAQDVPLVPLVAAQSLYGTVPLVVLALAFEPLPTVTTPLMLTVLYAGVAASAAGWLLLGALLRRGEAGAVSAQLFAVPVLGAVFGVMLGGEALHLSLVVGTALVTVGIRLASTEGRRAKGAGAWPRREEEPASA